MFAGWDEHPPTNILVKALLDGLSGGAKPKTDAEGNWNIPPEALAEMQKSAVASIQAKADPGWLPVKSGPDKGMPKMAPIFDVDELKAKNAEALQRMIRRRAEGV